MVITRAKNTQVARRMDGRRVLWQTIPNRRSILGHRRLLHIISGLCSNQEPFMAENGIEVGGRALEQVEESAEMQIGLFVVDVKFASVGLFGGQVGGEDFGFEAFSELVFELGFGVETVGGGPGLRQGQAGGFVLVFAFDLKSQLTVVLAIEGSY